MHGAPPCIVVQANDTMYSLGARLSVGRQGEASEVQSVDNSLAPLVSFIIRIYSVHAPVAGVFSLAHYRSPTLGRSDECGWFRLTAPNRVSDNDQRIGSVPSGLDLRTDTAHARSA